MLNQIVIVISNSFSSGHITYFDFGRGENLKYLGKYLPPFKTKTTVEIPIK
jgi:hypothetical protein